MQKIFLNIVLLGTLAFASEQFSMSEADKAMYEDMVNPAEMDVELGEEILSEELGGEKYLAQFLDVSEKELAPYISGFPRYIKKLKNIVGLDQVLQVIQVQKGQKKEKLGSEKLLALESYVKNLANDENVSIDVSSKEMKEAYSLGEKLFTTARGGRGLACIGCHQTHGALLRSQFLPHLGKIGTGASWPAYRMTQSKISSMQQRFQGCMSDSLQAPLPLGSKEMVALEVYLTKLAKEEHKVIAIPGFKR